MFSFLSNIIIMKIILILLLLIAYVLFLRQTCACTENMEDLSNLSILPPVISNNKSRININDLPECKMPMKIQFGSNQNSLVNDGRQLVQNMTNPHEQSSIVGNKKHILKQVSWCKSNLNWYGEEMPLEIRLTNTNIDDNTVTHIVFPVKLVEQNKLKEGFADMKPLNLNNFLSDSKTKDALDYLGTKLNIPMIKQEKLQEIIPKNIQETTLFKSIQDSSLVKKIQDPSLMKNIQDSVKNIQDSKIFKNIQEIIPVNTESLLKNISNMNSEEVISKINSIKTQLSGINLDKLDVKEILTTDNINLKSLNKKLNDMNFNQISQNFKNQQFSLHDINSLLNLNSILQDSSVVPAYKCCGSTFGKVVNIDLCQTATKIVNQEKFFFAQGNDGSLVLITKPQPYDKKIGQTILNNLQEFSPLVVG